ncbi:MAG: hypothetical protein MJB12_18240 [Firmicutes bacterium]|nr:hypothetical protein [Bacillota bacterium]
MYQVVLYDDVNGYCPVADLISELDQKAQTSKESRIELKQIMLHIDVLEKNMTTGYIGKDFSFHPR